MEGSRWMLLCYIDISLPLYKKISKNISIGEDLKKKDYSLKPLDLNLGKLRPREGKGLAMVIQLLVGLEAWSPDYQPGVYSHTPAASYAG